VLGRSPTRRCADRPQAMKRPMCPGAHEQKFSRQSRGLFDKRNDFHRDGREQRLVTLTVQRRVSATIGSPFDKRPSGVSVRLAAIGNRLQPSTSPKIGRHLRTAERSDNHATPARFENSKAVSRADVHSPSKPNGFQPVRLVREGASGWNSPPIGDDDV
jgi:hypothetical protein